MYENKITTACHEFLTKHDLHNTYSTCVHRTLCFKCEVMSHLRYKVSIDNRMCLEYVVFLYGNRQNDVPYCIETVVQIPCQTGCSNVMWPGAPHVLVVKNKARSRIPTEGSIQCMKPHNHRPYVQRSGWLTFTGHFAPYYM